MTTIKIPDVTDVRIIDALETIRPVVKHEGALWWIAIRDPRRVSFTWEPRLLSVAGDLVPRAKIRTLHAFG